MKVNLKPLNHKGKAQNKSEGGSSRGNKGCSEGSSEAGGLTIYEPVERFVNLPPNKKYRSKEP
jgi:hypothetical protein